MKQGGSFLLEPVVGKIFTREQFTEEQQEINEMVRQFARERIYPNRGELGTHAKELHLQLMKEASELGLTAIDVPEAYGGMDMDKITSAMVVEALTTGQSASWMVTFLAHCGIGTLPIVYFGSEAQKATWLPKLTSVDYLSAYALTEPGAGSDALNIKTSAHLSEDGTHYVLTGTKQFITNGGWADLFIIFAKIDDSDFTAFVVPRDTEGLTIGPEEEKMGIRGSSTTSVTLENCRVPVENLLGERGKGHHIAFNILNIGRFKLGAADLGGCKACVGQAVTYALERKQFGQPIATFDAIRSKFADMVVRTYVLDSAIYRTVGLMEERISTLDPSSEDYRLKVWDALEAFAIEASIAKILGSETLFGVSDHGIQIYGGYGFIEEYPMAGVFRDTRIDRIYEGTNEINRMVIYGYLLKNALLEEIPLRESVKTWTKMPSMAEGPFAWEIQALEAMRRMVMKLVDRAIGVYGQDLRNEQIVGEQLADLVIGYYGASSALNRVLHHDGSGRDRALKSIVRLAVTSVLKQFTGTIHGLAPTLYPGKEWEQARGPFSELFMYTIIPFNPVDEIRHLTDDLYQHQTYRYE
ncbi:MAG TPA: acyl-CoA dehydrogenase family protein [Thermoanaerobaculia bacterium]|nr:acyl-CoA dehydrogenase family protein [Thermoanaerobaculia bacterium]HUM28702.1 acyl-CoA dehydrogenase family protein [Thermoanaerobaculia bacterium]HXK68049.1 acyl-CoA dehydrogenase family protein [Thermoanaerobaculia bacterium]